MKIFNLTHNADGGVACWDTMPDSVMLRSGKPLFLPDSGEEYVLCPTLCLKVGRLGKRIAAKFARRYLSGMAPTVRVIPASALQLIEKGETPPAQMTVFDGALMLGDFLDTITDEGGIEIVLEVTTPAAGATATETLRMLREGTIAEKSESSTWIRPDIGKLAASALEAVSRYNTVKTGDLLLLGIDPPGAVDALIGQSAAARLQGEELLRFRIR